MDLFLGPCVRLGFLLDFSFDFWLVVCWIFRLDFLGRLGAADFEDENQFVLTSELKNCGGCPRRAFTEGLNSRHPIINEVQWQGVNSARNARP